MAERKRNIAAWQAWKARIRASRPKQTWHAEHKCWVKTHA